MGRFSLGAGRGRPAVTVTVTVQISVAKLSRAAWLTGSEAAPPGQGSNSCCHWGGDPPSPTPCQLRHCDWHHHDHQIQIGFSQWQSLTVLLPVKQAQVVNLALEMSGSCTVGCFLVCEFFTSQCYICI